MISTRKLTPMTHFMFNLKTHKQFDTENINKRNGKKNNNFK